MKKNGIILALVVFVAFAWAWFSGGGLQPATVEAAEDFKAAFIYVGPIADLGWSQEHDRGRKMLDQEFGGRVKSTYIESVPEGPDAARVIRQYAQQGYKVIFATSFGYMDPMLEVARDFPDTYFEHCSGFKTAPNMSTYFGRMYQPRYLSGIVAGEMTKSNIIGYAAAFPIPEVIRGINAFTLGARSVNPEAQVRVVWTNTWFDPVKEREAAVALLDAGADIIAQHQDTTEPQKAAQERGLLSIGYDSDMRGFVGDSVLVSPIWNWGAYYVDTVKTILNGTWKTHQYWGGLKEGIVELSEFSPKVPQAVKDMVLAKQQAILNGSWDVFYGPIKDQSGKEVVAAGSKMSDGDMLNMGFFVEGVIGKAGK
jgi:basic membrane protein A